MRFSEALALTPKDFDFSHQTLSISKTWDYKGNGGFLPTKNKSSVRKIQMDWLTVMQFARLVKNLPEDKPIFVEGTVYNSTVNGILERHCKNAGIPVISVHGLRHTHASLLLFAGVSIASVARRLGHASMTTTQKTYLHIIQELESKDVVEAAVEADPITKLKMKSQGGDAPQKLKMTPKAAPEAEPKPAAFTGKSAQAAQEEEEEELIVGEVEEGVKRNQVLIGDGDEDADFEFL